ncbi:MAG: prepilin-type N-terminal cleavage/methylation domain-containing protein [Candidatus Daviesbacteria bacterium]|nr:prepilin-type N-terminal cleavage/methylation domain-containing protein [Candidatus Daviesbacteria bacterium]
MSRGFTLIELLVVISIIAILAAIVSIIINPIETIRRARDATRLSDLANLQIGINVLIQEKPGASQIVLCQAPATPPCFGISTDPSSRNPNGSGWVKVKFDPQGPISASTLPIDPLNSGPSIYQYATNETGDKWEINATLESDREGWRMSQDGGNNLQKYEVGLSLNILQ